MFLKPIRVRHKAVLLCAAAAAPGPIDIEACASDLNQDCCGVFRETIQAKFCPGSNGGDDYYVYRLKNVPVCDMAYCAEGGSKSNNGIQSFSCLTLNHHNNTLIQLEYLQPISMTGDVLFYFPGYFSFH